MNSDQSISLQPVRGMRDFYPEDMRMRNWLFQTWRDVSLRYGFEEYDSCVLELEQLYIRKAGDEITGQLYNFADKGERRVALRPEMTPSLARMLLARSGGLKLPLRWFSIPQCFRYEKMQKGRKREHFQWNMDVVGLAHVAAEIELMDAQVSFLRAAGLQVDSKPEVALRVSDRRVLEHFLADLDISGDAFAKTCVIIDKCDKVGDAATREQLVQSGVSEGHADRILQLLKVRGLDALAREVGEQNAGYQSLRELLSLAHESGIAPLLDIDLSVVRGLSYYTGTVWELFDTKGQVPRAIAGGGRYDRLMESLGGRPTPMVGFGFGDVVISLLLSERNLGPGTCKRVDCVLYPMRSEQFAAANRVAAALRRKGKRVLVDYSEKRFKHVVKTAEEAGADDLFILGESELAKGVVKLRSLVDRSERELPLTDF